MLNLAEIRNASRVKEVQQQILSSQQKVVTDSGGKSWCTIPSDLDAFCALKDADEIVNGAFYAANADKI